MTKYILIEKATGKNLRIVDDSKQTDNRSDWHTTYVEEQGYKKEDIEIISENDLEISLDDFNFDLYKVNIDKTVEFKGEIGYRYYFGTEYTSSLITGFSKKEIHITTKRLLSENEIKQLESDLNKQFIEFDEFKQLHIKVDIE